MKKLALLKWIFLSFAIFCAIVLVASLALRFTYWNYCFSFALIGGALAGALFSAAYKKLSAAQGIMETAIIRIQPAVICAQSDAEKKKGEKLREKSEMYVSCFGILLGTKIIKFNQGGVRLRNVEIGNDYISFGYEIPVDSYGVEKEKQSIRLLYSKPDEDELAGIIEKFREETGVTPVVTGFAWL